MGGNEVTHEPELSEDQLADLMLQEAIEAHLDQEENDPAVKAEFMSLFEQRYHDGEVVVEVKRIIRKHMWDRANSRARSRTGKLLRAFAKGQFTLTGVDELLDAPMVAGKGRKTTMRHINATDLARIIREREENAENAKRALEEDRELASVLAEALRRYGSLSAAIAAGWLTPSQEEQSA